MGLQYVTACADSGLRVDHTIRVGRADTEVIVRHQIVTVGSKWS
jgi:hypothetical protein